MNKILVTGASGFVGKNLIYYLEEKSLTTIPFTRNNGLKYDSIDDNYIDKNEIDTIVHLAGKAHDLKNISNENE